MNGYVFLGGAILLELVATTALKASDGFSRALPSVVCALGYMASFYCLAQTLKHMPTGVAYAIWSGVGIVLISLAAWVFHGQRPDLASVAGMSLIVAGVVVIQVFSNSGTH